MEALYHPITKRQIDAIMPASASYIFSGRPGTGRRLAAMQLAKRLNCPDGGEGSCAICQTVEAGSFADLKIIESSVAIGIEQIQELQQALAQRPFSAETTRVVIIEADTGITREAQNRLLKTLEEPPRQTILILITEDASSLLSTVSSRCQLIQFVQPASEYFDKYLTERIGEAGLVAVKNLKPASVGHALVLARDAEAREARAEDLTFAAKFLESPVFNRLVMINGIRSRNRAMGLVSAMATLSTRATTKLLAYDAFERSTTQLLANVNPRVTLEALALSL